MSSHNPLETDNRDLNPQHAPDLPAQPACAARDEALPNNAQQGVACQTDAKDVPTSAEPDEDANASATPPAEPAKNPVGAKYATTLKSRLEPDHSKPVDRQKFIYSIILILLALAVIGLLQNLPH